MSVHLQALVAEKLRRVADTLGQGGVQVERGGAGGGAAGVVGQLYKLARIQHAVEVGVEALEQVLHQRAGRRQLQVLQN